MAESEKSKKQAAPLILSAGGPSARPILPVPSAVPRPPFFSASPPLATAHVAPEKNAPQRKIFPDPPKSGSASIAMSKTQPLVSVTARPKPPPPAPVISAPVPVRVAPAIPLPLCWAIVVAAAIILLIEIWNYIS